ncbi:acylpyruvase FAHD1, mitochondrial-like [Choloepus didactylus]|uniref:acylpyruvase FAHD1, mitochondrial-like n=1 Tax=Choloepus didactylus TaxID=27675 RepID=UPI0018A09180|nr:acylpyruvase FAHD1, mitochondrial-like [Choloepus didactylus]
MCMWRNYNHIEEMRSMVPSKPLLFLKPSTAYAPEGSPVFLSPYSRCVHHELELELGLVMGTCRRILLKPRPGLRGWLCPVPGHGHRRRADPVQDEGTALDSGQGLHGLLPCQRVRAQREGP